MMYHVKVDDIATLTLGSEISGNDKHLCVRIRPDTELYESQDCYAHGVVGMCLVASKTLFYIKKIILLKVDFILKLRCYVLLG